MKCIPSKWTAVLLTAVVLSASVWTNVGAATEKSPAEKSAFSRRNPITEAVIKTKPSVVTIRVPRPNGGKDIIGTGVVIDERGFIVTNRHVIGAGRSVRVRLADGSDVTAQVIFSESAWDLAVLRIETSKDLQALPLAPVADLMVGETVIAVGHPYGYTNTVSTGIISALGREITMPSGDTLTELIQTTAPINPGNSGGPLLNINGELIGIVVALRDGAQNIAFAINAGTVKEVLSKHLSAVRVSGVYHGLKCAEKILGETGDRQRVVLAGTESQLKDLTSGDEILAVGEKHVTNAFDVERALWGKKPGETVALKVVRQGKELTVNLTLAAGNGAGSVAALSGTQQQPLAALATKNVTAANR